MTAIPTAATSPGSPVAFVLVLNCGSSSIKFALFALREVGTAAGHDIEPRSAWNGKVQGIGGPKPDFGARGIAVHPVTLEDAHPYRSALRIILRQVDGWLAGRALASVAHRVVHGGDRYLRPTRLDPRVLADLHDYIPLAPLHQPFALEAIQILLDEHPDLPQIACFDTAFHQTLPKVERMLPLPYDAWERGLRRYGFHGLSYEYIAGALADRHGEATAASARTIVAHLGSGASLCAMDSLRSVATTMGFSALDGLMMGTRTGSIDAGAVLYLMQIEKLGVDEVARLLYSRSGLLGVSGLSSDPRDLIAREDDGTEAGERAALAMQMYVRRIVREIAALTATLGGLDRLVFTAGVGEHNATVRARVVEGLGWLGLSIDAAANEANAVDIAGACSRVAIEVVPTDEEVIAARAAADLLGKATGEDAKATGED